MPLENSAIQRFLQTPESRTKQQQRRHTHAGCLVSNPTRSTPPPPATFPPAFVVSGPRGWTTAEVAVQGTGGQAVTKGKESMGKLQGADTGPSPQPHACDQRKAHVVPYGIQHRFSMLQLDTFPTGSGSKEGCKRP